MEDNEEQQEEEWQEDWSDEEDEEEHEWQDHPQGPQLRQAARKGQTERVRELLDQGVDVDARDVEGWTALMRASGCGHAEVVKLLLSRQAQVDAQDHVDSTAVMYAALDGHVETVKLLEAAGADIHHKNNGGVNALMWAALFDRLPICLFLLSKGADLMAAANDNETALTRYGQWINNPALSPATLVERRTALEEAWRSGPHPSQVQRRRDEAWDRRKSLMQVSAENGYRPLAHRVAAMPAVDPAAAIPAIPLDNAEQVHAHLLGQVLANEGIHRNIVSML